MVDVYYPINSVIEANDQIYYNAYLEWKIRNGELQI